MEKDLIYRLEIWQLRREARSLSDPNELHANLLACLDALRRYHGRKLRRFVSKKALDDLESPPSH